jgi:large subunit ribosomal protein L32
MAPLPKRRHSTRRGGKRKAAISYALIGLTKCPKCNALRVAHRVCPTCGYYNDKAVVVKKVKKTKKAQS